MADMHVQSVLVNRDVYPNLYRAIAKVLKLHFIVPKIDITDDYWRFRQEEPNNNEKYRTEESGKKGIKYIIQY
jgi:hypothetical protein